MYDDFTSCAVCQHNNGEKCELFGRVIGMHGCSSGIERKPRNNYEKLKAMSMNEMAEEIVLLLCRFPLDYEKLLEWLKEEIADA